MIDSSMAIMLLILLGVIITVILVIAVMASISSSDKNTTRTLEGISESVTEIREKVGGVQTLPPFAETEPVKVATPPEEPVKSEPKPLEELNMFAKPETPEEEPAPKETASQGETIAAEPGVSEDSELGKLLEMFTQPEAPAEKEPVSEPEAPVEIRPVPVPVIAEEPAPEPEKPAEEPVSEPEKPAEEPVSEPVIELPPVPELKPIKKEPIRFDEIELEEAPASRRKDDFWAQFERPSAKGLDDRATIVYQRPKPEKISPSDKPEPKNEEPEQEVSFVAMPGESDRVAEIVVADPYKRTQSSAKRKEPEQEKVPEQKPEKIPVQEPVPDPAQKERDILKALTAYAGMADGIFFDFPAIPKKKTEEPAPEPEEIKEPEPASEPEVITTPEPAAEEPTALTEPVTEPVPLPEEPAETVEPAVHPEEPEEEPPKEAAPVQVYKMDPVVEPAPMGLPQAMRFTDRNCGVDKYGRMYSVDDLRKQIR